MRNNSVAIDTTHGLLYSFFSTKCAASETSARPQVVLTDETLKTPSNTTKTVTDSIDHASDWNTTDTVTPGG